jgi:hypothetical protein
MFASNIEAHMWALNVGDVDQKGVPLCDSSRGRAPFCQYAREKQTNV